ncbi:MAG: NAD(P)H-dependent glycerol-3-phosphate dehydrogenase [Nanoarchaeota archaeon]
MEKITIIGAGSWGTVLAAFLGEKGYNVSLWCRRKELADEINKLRENKQYLSKVKIPGKVIATNSVKEAAEKSSIIVFAIPSLFFRSIANSFSKFITKDSIILHVTKGMEERSGKTMSHVLKEELGKNMKIAVMSGPNHAEEVALKLPTATVIASENKEVREYLCRVFSTPYFKPYTHDDVIGVEVCGAVKNIAAIAIGVCDGLNFGDNAKGSILTLGLSEMNTIGREFGAKRATCYGLAGVGDLVATCFSEHSRNRNFGYMLAKGRTVAQIQKDMHGMVAEGVLNTKVIHNICVKNRINAPLIAQIYEVLYGGVGLRKAVDQLLTLV